MRQTELTHPRVFDDREWADGYYRRNRKNIARTGVRLAKLLKASGCKGGPMLDVGCGFASVPIALAREFPESHITGIDLGEPLLELGQSLVNKSGLSQRISLQKQDAEQCTFPDASFDVVINTFLLHIIENPVRMLNEIERIAKPGAFVVITDLRRGMLAWFMDKFKTAYTLEEALQVIRKSSLREGKPATGFFWWDYLILG